MIKLTPRNNQSKILIAITPIIAVLFTMIFGGILFWVLGKNPFEAIKLIFWDPLMSETFSDYARPQILVKASPLILIALGLSVGFKANIWNIGAEGQFIMGALISAGIGLALYPMENRLIFPLMVVCGTLGGTLWALIPAILKSRFNTNEILVSLMLVYIAEQALASASIGILRNPEGSGFPGSRNLNQYPSASNPELIAGSGVHWGVVFSILTVWFFHYLLKNHKFGFQIKLFGDAPRAASFAGLKSNYIILLCFSISGGLAGMAGMFELTGPAGAITIDFNVGYGFTAIIVAFLGRLNPIGILFAGLLMALTYVGGEISQFMLGIPAAAIQVFQGMLLFFLLSIDLIVKFQLSFIRNKHISRKE
ncbi:MAG: sugar ABC transporter permease [Rhodobacteraceae bacterium]|nr:MAG: sugar ABC transporter permease [Paracoccaceae bacterium]|tara:strand:+ start:1821 stop:2918 length:1098 start_codon:yes stop_codon:yes gene_type:complete